jgi:hypothetical protein
VIQDAPAASILSANSAVVGAGWQSRIFADTGTVKDCDIEETESVDQPDNDPAKGALPTYILY